jgi:hypothetical protein
MMRCFTVNWNQDRGEAEVKYAEWFTPKAQESYTQLIMLDAINDVIAELHEVYDEIYAETYKEKT